MTFLHGCRAERHKRNRRKMRRRTALSSATVSLVVHAASDGFAILAKAPADRSRNDCDLEHEARHEQA